MGMFDSLGGIVMGLGSAYGQARRAKRGMPAGGGLLTQYLAQQQEEEELAQKQKMIEDERNASLFEDLVRERLRVGSPIEEGDPLMAQGQSLGYNTDSLSKTSQETFQAMHIAPHVQQFVENGIVTPEGLATARSIQDLNEIKNTAKTAEEYRKLQFTIMSFKQYGSTDGLHALAHLNEKERNIAMASIDDNPELSMNMLAEGSFRFYKSLNTGKGGGGGTPSPGSVSLDNKYAIEFAKKNGLSKLSDTITGMKRWQESLSSEQSSEIQTRFGDSALMGYLYFIALPNASNLTRSMLTPEMLADPVSNRKDIVGIAADTTMFLLSNAVDNLTIEQRQKVAIEVGVTYAKSLTSEVLSRYIPNNTPTPEEVDTMYKVLSTKPAAGFKELWSDPKILKYLASDANKTSDAKNPKITQMMIKNWILGFGQMDEEGKRHVAEIIATFDRLRSGSTQNLDALKGYGGLDDGSKYGI